jgi:hypothetical protein
MMVDYKKFVEEYYNMGFSVQDCVAVININGGDITWNQVADMYMKIECEEEGK